MNETFARILDSLACPQCGSGGCGPYRCRFSSKTHAAFRQERINAYAEAKIAEERANSWRPDQDLDVDGRPLKAGS